LIVAAIGATEKSGWRLLLSGVLTTQTNCAIRAGSAKVSARPKPQSFMQHTTVTVQSAVPLNRADTERGTQIIVITRAR